MQDIRMQTFLKVCETLNFTKAAKELNITQPAVSQHIKYLEEYYGKKLFLHKGRQVFLTKAGLMLKKASIAIRNDERYLMEQIKSSNDDNLEINFGVTKTIGEYIIAGHLANFVKNNPDRPVNMVIDNTEVLLEQIKAGKLQFALVEGFFDHKEFDSLLYDTVPFVPVCAANHSFEKKPKQLRDLLSETVIVREENSGSRIILERQLSTQEIKLRDFAKVIQIGGMHAILQMVEEDAGISFMYESAAKKAIVSGVIREIKLKDFKVVHDFAFVWDKRALFGSDYREICSQIVGH